MPHLLDTNLLIASFWPSHRHYAKAAAWFDRERSKGWATCPLTEAGFVRILSNPSFSEDALAIADAIRTLRVNIVAGDHLFWPDELPFIDAVAFAGSRLVGHQQTTDAYLLGLALHRGGVLATLDGGISSLVGKDPFAAAALTVIE